jgi:hypothetical protein
MDKSIIIFPVLMGGFMIALLITIAVFKENDKIAKESYEKQYPIGSQYIISDGKFTVIYCYPDGDVKLLSSTGQETICSSKLLSHPVKINVEGTSE